MVLPRRDQVTKTYDARLATRITTSVDSGLRQLALLQRRRISHLLDDLLDAVLPTGQDLAAQPPGPRPRPPVAPPHHPPPTTAPAPPPQPARPRAGPPPPPPDPAPPPRRPPRPPRPATRSTVAGPGCASR